MAKNLLIVSFLLCMAFGLAIFWAKRDENLLESIEKAEAKKAPRIVLNDFELRRYRQGKQILFLSAKLAQMPTAEQVILEGDVRGWREDEGKRQRLAAGQAEIEFSSKNLETALTKAEIKFVQLRGGVEIQSDGYKMNTSACEFLASGQLLRSGEPSWFYAKASKVHSSRGFVYNLLSQDFELFGQTKGELIPSD